MSSDTDQLKRDIVAALKAEQWHQALPLLEQWCGLFPDHAKSWLNRGYCLVKLGRYSEAVAVLDRSLELDPDSATARGWREQALSELDKETLQEKPAPAVQSEAAAAPASLDGDTRVDSSSDNPPSFATISSPHHGKGWLEGSVVDGRYEVREVARGGMAVVAIAFDRELQRMVAIKTPLPSVLATEDGRARFQREAESWIALGVHPNICCAYYLQEIGGMPRLFIEYVDGGDLSQWMKRDDPPAFEERLDVAIQIASGLDYTHTFLWKDDDGAEHQGVVHRDIKPANVLLSSEGIAHVTDFGLVRAEGAEDETQGDVRGQVVPSLRHTGRRGDSISSGSWQTVTMEGGLVGTPPYMAPELWRQALRGTVATDVYAYGCLLYEILCGRRPFVMSNDSGSQTREAHLGGWMRMHLMDDPPDPTALEPVIGERLGALMRSCIAKDAAHRPQSFALLRGWLVEVFEDTAGKAYPRPMPQRTQLLADSLNNRGVSFVTLGFGDRASRSFRKALAVDPRHVEATFNSALFEWRRDGLNDAELERRLGEAVRASGTGGSGGLLLGRLRLLLDNPRGAVEALEESGARTVAERRELGLALLAQTRSGVGNQRIDEARALLAGVIEESPSDVVAAIGLAEACRDLGDDEFAAEAFERARRLDPDLEDQLTDAVAARLPGHSVARTMAHHGPVQSLRALPEGWLVTRTASGEGAVWEPEGERPVHSIEFGGPARQGRSMAVADDLLVACLENGPLTLFDVANGQRLRNFRPHPGVATCAEFSPDNRTIASGGSDRTVRLWDIESGECTRSFQGHGAFVSAVIWHPTQPWLVSAGADGTVRVWNLDQGRCAHVFEGHRGPVRALALSDDGTLVLSAGQDGTVAVWDLENRRNIRFLRGHRGAVIAVAQVEGTIAAGGEDGTVRLWKLDDGRALRVIRLPNPIQDLVTDIDGTRLLVAHGTTVSLLSLPGQLETKLPLVLAESAASAELAGRESEFRTHLDHARTRIEAGEMEAAIPPLRAAREVPGYELHEEVVALWNTVLAFFPKAAPRSILELRRIGTGRRAIGATALMPDGTTCVAGAADGSLRVFDAVSGSEKGTFGGHDHGVTSIDVSEDGEWLASSGRDGAVRVWNISTGEIRMEFLGHEGAVQAVAFAPDGTAVISAGDDGSVRLWPLNDVDLPVQFGRDEDAVSALAVSSDGRFVVSGGWNNNVTVWSLARRAELRRMKGHEGAVNAVAISPDCRVIASAGEDSTVRLWDLEGGRSRRVLSGHEGAVQALGFTPDARFLLSAGNDATLRLWDVRTGTAAHVVEGHAGQVFDIDLDRDGGLALSAGSDSRLRLWFLDWEPELPERGSWDDRVRPFLDVFLRRCEANVKAPGQPGWNESGFDALLEDLGRRGFGWLAPDRVRRELKSLALNRDEDRAEERERTHELVKRRQRQKSVAPAKKIITALTNNLGLKLAGALLIVIVGILGVMSLSAPQSEDAEINRVLFGDVGLLVRERGLRLQRGAVLAYQHNAVLESPECRAEDIESQTRLALESEQATVLPLDPGTPAEDEDFRERYAQAVFCVGDLGGDGVVQTILRQGELPLHPYRLEDLLSILIRVGGASDPLVVEALTDHVESVRHLAALALVHGGSAEGAGMLINALQGDEMRGVEAASFVLTELISTGAIEESQSFDTVRRLCRSIDPRVRRNAVRSLVLFESVGPARQLLDEALEDSDVEVALAAERTLKMIRTMKIQQIFGSN